jgi:CelD/BcsL family acetyltransferase involved in cellulose biosynthesis
MAGTGLLRFDELWAGGECHASIYGFDNGETFYYYNTGYDPEWASYSVGLVLTGLSIRNAVERGVGTYDFLRGDEAYKFDWANKMQQLVNVTLARNTVVARLAVSLADANARSRSVAKALLPFSLAETARKWRWALTRKTSDVWAMIFR